jgi:hypothetical protein
MEIHAVGDKLFHVDRRPDMAKLTVAFRNCANVLRIKCCENVLEGVELIPRKTYEKEVNKRASRKIREKR